MESQASLVQVPVDSLIAANVKAMESQASLVQGPVDSLIAANSKAMKSQASFVHGPVDRQLADDLKVMKSQASLVQGHVGSHVAANSKAMESQASLVQGPVDSQIAADTKVMKKEVSLVQGHVDNQIAATSKAAEREASQVQVDNQTTTKARPIENQTQNSTVSHTSLKSETDQVPAMSMVRNQTSVAMGARDSQNNSLSSIQVNQTSPAPDLAIDSMWQACENRTVQVQQAGAEMPTLKSATRAGSLDIKRGACPRFWPTQAFAASGDNSPRVPAHMVLQEAKTPVTQVFNERKSFQDQINSSNFNETWSKQNTCNTALPSNGETVSRHPVSSRTVSSHARRKIHIKHDAMGLHQQETKRHRKKKAPSTLRRDRARTQQWIQDKKTSIHGKKIGEETSMTQTNSCHLPRQEERTARSCPACVGTLLEHAGNNTDVMKLKQNIVLELGPNQFHDKTRTIYGAMVHLLPNKKEWQLTQLMQAPGTGFHETCVHTMVRELKAEGKTLGHLLHYFCQEETKRADIVKLITKMHQCDFCTNTAADVI